MSSAAHITTEPRSRWERVAFSSGIAAGAVHVAFLALFIVLVVPDMPPMDAPAAQAVAFYAEQSRSPIYMLISYLFQAQLLLLIPFFGGLYGILRRAEGPDGPLATSVFGAGVAAAIIPALAEMIEHHLLLGLAAAGGDPVIVRGFDGMAPVSFGLSGFPQAIVLAGTAALIFGRQIAPRWLGWCGAALAAICLAGSGVLVDGNLFFVGMLAALLFKLWVLALSVALLRSPRAEVLPLAQGLRAQ
jgi:hypothetical protein